MIPLLALSLAAASLAFAQSAVTFDVSTSARDLQASDFQIFDNDKRQELVYFRPLSPPAATPTILLFDISSARFAALDYEKTELVQTLKAQPASANLFVYLRTADGVYPVRPLELEPVAVDQIQPRLDAAFSKLPGLDFAGMTAVEFTCDALQDLLSKLALIPGRKNLVWVTFGFPNYLDKPMAPDSPRPVVDLIDNLNRNHIAVYALERTYAVIAERYLPGTAHHTLEVLAAATGGRFNELGAPERIMRVDTNPRGYYNFKKMIGEARDDASNLAYRVAYLRAADAWDGKHHKLRVAIARKDVKLQTRQDDYAFPPPSDADRSSIETAAAALRDSPDVAFRATAPPPTDRITLSIRVDASTILLLPEGGNFHAALTMAVLQYDDAGERRLSPLSSVKVTLTPEQRQRALSQGLELKFPVPAEPGTRRIRIVVYDRILRTTGSLSIPL